MQTIDLNYKISGTKIFLPFKAICSVTDKEFSGHVIIEYSPNLKVLEYVDAETKVNLLCKDKVTAEDIVNNVYKEVYESIKPDYLKVLLDVDHSDAHQPVQVWLESK